MESSWRPKSSFSPIFAFSFGSLGFGWHFGSILGRLRIQKIAKIVGGVSKIALSASCENVSKMTPKWSQNGSRNHQKWLRKGSQKTMRKLHRKNLQNGSKMGRVFLAKMIFWPPKKGHFCHLEFQAPPYGLKRQICSKIITFEYF